MTIIEDLEKNGTYTNPVSGELLPDHAANPHTGVDVIHGSLSGGTITAINAAKDAIVAAINGRPDYTAQLTSIGDTLTAMKSDTAAINTGVASSLVLLQAIVDKPDPTPVDLQPVLDKLDELIALETTENSTLVDVKNQLIAANVTLSSAEALLTHIDADMHDVVAKLQSALDLLTSLQTLLTTIDGRIAAIQTAITTADANNVSALNDIRTELQAINVNTDTLEALITAGNVLLTAIASNTDEVESKLDALIALLTPTTRIVKTGSGYISSGTGTTNFGGSSKPYEAITGLQSITVTVVQSGTSAVGADVVNVTTDTGSINLLAGMSMTFSVEQDSYNKAEELSNVFKAEALGNSAAIVHYTYEGTVTPVRTAQPN